MKNMSEAATTKSAINENFETFVSAIKGATKQVKKKKGLSSSSSSSSLKGLSTLQ
jgi:hypothetical protein